MPQNSNNASDQTPAPAPGSRTLPEPGLRTRGDFLRKLSYYLAGLAIGFILLGVFQKLRQQEKARRAAEREALINAEQAPSPFFPPTPSQQQRTQDAGAGNAPAAQTP